MLISRQRRNIYFFRFDAFSVPVSSVSTLKKPQSMSISFIHSHVNVMFTTQNITTPRAMQ
jgi:hypothetical protein